MSPGRKFSITTSADRAIRRAAAAPSDVWRSSATERLFRLSDRKYAASSPTNGGPHAGEEHRRERPREHPGEVGDANALERQVIGRGVLHGSPRERAWKSLPRGRDEKSDAARTRGFQRRQ